MKNLFTSLLLILLISASVFCQPPQAFKYQAVVRDATGEIISNQPVDIRISIRNGSPGGTIAYQETFLETTNQFGMVNLNIGTGTPVIGTFSGIDWSSGAKFMQVDKKDGSIYNLLGTSELSSVPYALYTARSADAYWGLNGSNIYYNSGNIGIGTNTPDTRLAIKTSAAGDVLKILDNTDNTVAKLRHTGNNSGALYLYDGSNNNSVFLYGLGTSFINGGSLGLGTASVSNAKLQIEGTGTYDAMVKLNNTGTNGASFFMGSTNDAWGGGVNQNLFVMGHGAPASANIDLTINSLGYLGIGTTSPNAPLHVEDRIRIGEDPSYGAVYGELIHEGGGNGFKINANAGGGWADMHLQTDGTTRVFIESAGNVGIGTTTLASGYKLSVAGKVACEEVLVELSGSWPDYVFDEKYKLTSLEDLESEIKATRHLPGFPSAKDVEAHGIQLGDMQKRLVQKVEELTLYTIEQEKKINEMKVEIDQIREALQKPESD